MAPREPRYTGQFKRDAKLAYCVRDDIVYVQFVGRKKPASAGLEPMNTVEQIELQLSRLSPEELARFRAWYYRFDADAWDRQVEQDATSGTLDALAQKALQAHAEETSHEFQHRVRM